jgi:hypothetical protein
MYLKNMYDENLVCNEVNRKHDIIFALAGLHHYSSDDLDKVMVHCANSVRDGGYFILREHDVTDEDDCVLVDSAHLVFNALTGEPHHIEQSELRLYRSRDDWIKLMKEYGFDHIINVYDDDGNKIQKVVIAELQKHDPTRNIMMCFQYNLNKSLLNGHSKLFKELGGKVESNFNSASQIPEWFNVEYTYAYSKFLIDYPWFNFPFFKAFEQMISTCKFVFFTEYKDSTKFSYDLIMSVFVIICHCVGCLLGSFFATIISGFIKSETVGGTRHVLIFNPTNYDLEKPVIFNEVNYKAKILKHDKKHYMSLVEIPMYRPFTELLKYWFENDHAIGVASISGNSTVWVDVRGEKIISEKWQIHTKESLIKKGLYLNTIKLYVHELRDLYDICKEKNCVMLQIFQQ